MLCDTPFFFFLRMCLTRTHRPEGGQGFCEMPPGGTADGSLRIDSGRPSGQGGPSAPIGAINKGASWTRSLSGLEGTRGTTPHPRENVPGAALILE